MFLNVIKLISKYFSDKGETDKNAPYDYLKEDIENHDYRETKVKEINNEETGIKDKPKNN
jgi:hypothetical protein